MITETKRKKYIREVTPSWWKSWDFYKFYMLRESTGIMMIWFCLELFYAAICLGNGSFETKLIPFLQNPLVMILNIITLAATILHAITLFTMTGDVISIPNVKPQWVRNTLRVACVVVTIVGLILVYL